MKRFVINLKVTTTYKMVVETEAGKQQLDAAVGEHDEELVDDFDLKPMGTQVRSSVVSATREEDEQDPDAVFKDDEFGPWES